MPEKPTRPPLWYWKQTIEPILPTSSCFDLACGIRHMIAWIERLEAAGFSRDLSEPEKWMGEIAEIMEEIERCAD